ncbi:MAG: dynamin family protein [Prevotella sp.]
MNEFLKFKQKIVQAKGKYLAVKKNDPHEGNIKDVEQLARPFERGYFTLALVGGMSSGKSSFLNAFLGEKDFLPTGGGQTTCSLTSIYYSKEEKVTIEYMDEHIEEHNATSKNNLREILKNTVAIPEAFGNGFPLLQVNNDILKGMTKDDILGNVEVYSEKAKRKIKTQELADYLKTHMDPSKFIKEVSVGINLPSLEGWRIVDTPGVCALGGIEELTRDFILGKDEYGYDNVDALLLMYNGILGLEGHPGLTEFINDLAKRKKSIFKDQSFMIVTHSAFGKFQANPDYITNALSQIDNLIPKERVFYVDNYFELFCRIRENEGKDFMDMISTESEKDWFDTIDKLESMAFKFSKKYNGKILNEDFITEIQKLSQFHILRKELENFIVERKQEAYDEIIQLIKEDLNNLVTRKKEEEAKVEKDLRGEQDLASQIEEEKRKNEACRLDFNSFANSLQEEYSDAKIRHRYQSILQAARKLTSLHSLSQIYAEAESIKNDLEQKKEEILDEVGKKSKNYFSDIQIPSFPVINFHLIVSEAEKSEKNKTDNWEKAEGLGNYLKRVFSKIAGKKYEHWGMKNNRKLDVKKASEDCQKEIVKAINGYVAITINVINKFITEANKKIKDTERIVQEKKDELVKNNKTVEDKENTIKSLEEEIDILTETIKSIDYEN